MQREALPKRVPVPDYLDADGLARDGPGCYAGIAQGLGLQRNFFETKTGGSTTAESSYWVTRVIHYPPLQQVRLLAATLSCAVLDFCRHCPM